jgi:hypothetical protein
MNQLFRSVPAFNAPAVVSLPADGQQPGVGPDACAVAPPVRAEGIAGLAGT